MTEAMNRRNMLKLAAWFTAVVSLEGIFSTAVHAQSAGDEQNGYALEDSSNFKAIYQDPQLKAAFFLFLKNVYTIFPEQRFHKLIEEVTEAGQSDREIYQLAQARLREIKPLLGDVRYALPALWRQKSEMAKEALALLETSRSINGYMEIGTTGRYISKLKSSIQLTGDVVLVNVDAPGYGPADIVERGQLKKLGRYVALKDYDPVATADVADGSLDLIANFIGFHHSPPAKLDDFVKSLHRALRPGGRLIVRDHDVNSNPMNRMVALAHDVFNMGLHTDWSVNQSEIRNFTSMQQLVGYLDGLGFKSSRKALFQPGDPTQNALMEFVRVV